MCYCNSYNCRSHQSMSFLFFTVVLTMVLCFKSVTCTVYNVTPNDIRCDHCINLLYLPNLTQNFTSNTQLYFLPGLHHLSTDLIIQNVDNISIIGSVISATTPSTVIQCASSVGIVMTNITNLTVKNIVIQNCESEHDSLQAAVFIKECNFIMLQLVHIYHASHVISLLGVNILGNSYLHEVKCQEIHFYYNELTVTARKHNILINSFYVMNHFKSEYGIYLNMSQFSYKVTLRVVNTTIQQLKRSVFLHAISNSSVNQNTIVITKCQFHNNNNYKIIKHLLYLEKVNVHFINSQFYNNYFKRTYHALVKITCSNYVRFFKFNFEHNWLNKKQPLMQYTNSRHFKEVSIIQITNVSNVTIDDCYFNDNKKLRIIDVMNAVIEIKNATFSVIQTASECTMLLHNSNLLLSGAVVFHKNRNNFASVIELLDSNITVHGYVEFSENYAFGIILFNCNRILSYCFIIKVLDNTIIVIVSNTVLAYFVDSPNPYPDKLPITYPQCLFQYFSTRNLNSYYNAGNFSIIIEYNRFENLSTVSALLKFFNVAVNKILEELLSKLQPSTSFSTITHCYWLPQSAFNTTIPLKVNNQYVTYTNNSQLLHMSREKTFCYCNDEKHYDCFKDELDSIYPGQTLTFSLYANVNYTYDTEVITELDINQPYVTQCAVINAKQNIQIIGKNCTTVSYAIAFPTNSWCELFIRMPQTHNKYDAYYISELPCPLGFVKIDGICQCYPSFKQFGFTECDIDTQKILRPSKGWILFNTNAQENDSYSYRISQWCPYDYCVPHAFYLNLSIPNSQCQFNRIGLLCGQCQQGLSTIFSSHDCQHCSNIYLLLLIPIGIAGLVLIMLLFLLNLTVTDGTINSFIFYMNIMSINYTVFFPNDHTTIPLYTLISLANLNLGIITCLYNGMDDYAKVWLQLAFPFYIISIAILIIIVSRYSITVQRLTVQKSSAVLATLFLFSFTTILRTISSVLFSYSSISDLPNEHTTLVWSLDANIPLFGVKFTLLFIICLILFLLLTFFTAIMLCANALKKFKFLNTILDTYQRPYRLHYWFGLQLMMRIIFFYISHLDKKINIVISTIILSIASAIQGTQKPFQNKMDNHNEILLVTNLFTLYVFTLSEWWIANEVLIVIAGIQFSCVIIYCVANQLCGRIIRNKLCITLDNKVVARLL